MNRYSNESMRFALASILLNGSTFRRKIIAIAQEKYRARPTEVGLDHEQLLKACLHFEKRETHFRLGMLGLGVVALTGLAAPLFGVLGVLGLVVLQVVKNHQERFVYADYFSRDNYHDDSSMQFLSEDKNMSEYRDDLGQSQNVTIYSDFDPFSVAGIGMGGWSFSIDISRPSELLTSNMEVELFGLYDIYGFVEKGIKNLKMDNLSISDHFFINGRDVQEFKELLPNQYQAPIQLLSDQDVAKFQLQSDVLRHYKWIQIKDWGNDLVLSFFLRYEIRGSNLFIEVSKTLLTPISEQYRKIDNIMPSSISNDFALAFGSVLKTPFALIGAMGYLYIDFMRDFANIFGSVDRNARRQIRNSPLYNYGEGQSLRANMSSSQYAHYFQKMDKEFYTKTLEKTILGSTIDFLERHNVDISELRDTQSTIINSGIIVQGGDVNSKNIAVGKGARASFGNMLNKVKSKATA